MVEAGVKPGLLASFGHRAKPKEDLNTKVLVENASMVKNSFPAVHKHHEGDTSSSCSDDDIVRSKEFIIQCADETVFVGHSESTAILQHCPYFRSILANASEVDGSVVRRADWSAANIRRVIDILTLGTTWIDNNAKVFTELRDMATELTIDIRLCSLVNYHDLLSASISRDFFNLLKIERYQFKFYGVVRSSHWVRLAEKKVILMPKAKVLPVKLDSSSKQSSPTAISAERLARCDSIASEYCVYGDGSMSALLSISTMLVSGGIKRRGKTPRNENTEQIKLVFNTAVGVLTDDQLSMFCRMTDVSFGAASEEETRFLLATQDSSKQGNGVGYVRSENHAFTIGLQRNVSAGQGTHNTEASSDTIPMTTVNDHEMNQNIVMSPPPCPPTQYSYKTLRSTSFLVLKHLFESINTLQPHLKACIIVTTPEPDMVGRMVNAASRCTIPRLELDVRTNSLFACKSSEDIKTMLTFMADYSSSAVIGGDFLLCAHE
eukprot:Nitzschia sp. Nitz4//scaffold5_size260463//99010//100485//NITZ4_000973-RA/size260463-processed-gene-0.124-mRNA-1//-1//CDS//3329555313//1866//frame0